MYLAIMLIVVTILVFYNEINNKMNLEEYILLGITFIAIVKASINYIQINKIQEGFESNDSKNKSKNKQNKSNYLVDEEYSPEHEVSIKWESVEDVRESITKITSGFIFKLKLS